MTVKVSVAKDDFQFAFMTIIMSILGVQTYENRGLKPSLPHQKRELFQLFGNNITYTFLS